MFYFFSYGRDGVVNLLSSEPKLSVFLLENGVKLGELDCELKDFMSERVVKREFFK